MYPTNASNWEHELTSVDSSSWKENKGEPLISVKICSFTSIDIALLHSRSLIWRRYLLHLLGNGFSNRVRLFLVRNFKYNLIWVFHYGCTLLLKRPTSIESLAFKTLKKSKTFFACSGCIVLRWCLSFDGFIDSALRTAWPKTHCGFSMSSLVSSVVKPMLRKHSEYLRRLAMDSNLWIE